MIRLKELINEILSEMPVITKQGKTAMAGSQPLKNLKIEDVKGNLVFIRQQEKGGFITEGWSVVYFFDNEESAKQMASGKMDYLMVPTGTFNSGGSPITDIWKKRFQKPGHEHILGVLQGNVMPDNIFIDMLTVRPGYQRNTIASKMVDLIKSDFPNAKITHSDPTYKGRSFLTKRKELEPKYNKIFWQPKSENVDSVDSKLKSIKDVIRLSSKMAVAAQKVYDQWDQSDVENDPLNGGGICQDIADEIAGVLNMSGVDATTVSAQIGEQHVWTVVKVKEGVYEVDIPPSIYETGGGYTWKKLLDVKFDSNDLRINRLSVDPENFNNYIDF